MKALLDSAIFMYAAGPEHPLRAPCRVVLARLQAGQIDATTSAEVVQEILLRYVAINRQDLGIAIAREALTLVHPVLPLSDAAIRRVPDLVERYPRLSARALVHVATCMVEGLDVIISPDRGFDAVSEINRLDPFEAAA